MDYVIVLLVDEITVKKIFPLKVPSLRTTVCYWPVKRMQTLGYGDE